MKTQIHKQLSLAVILASTTGACAAQPTEQFYKWFDVSGTAIHYFDNTILHSENPTNTGVRKYVTETVELFGDVEGRVLYQPVTNINLDENTLVNRGNQVFSGTIMGIGPVMLHDDSFRFEIDLETGATVGKVFLSNRIAGPFMRCRLDIVGTGMTPEGNGLADYSGKCRMMPNENPENRF